MNKMSGENMVMSTEHYHEQMQIVQRAVWGLAAMMASEHCCLDNNTCPCVACELYRAFLDKAQEVPDS